LNLGGYGNRLEICFPLGVPVRILLVSLLFGLAIGLVWNLLQRYLAIHLLELKLGATATLGGLRVLYLHTTEHGVQLQEKVAHGRRMAEPHGRHKVTKDLGTRVLLSLLNLDREVRPFDEALDRETRSPSNRRL